MTFIHVYLTDEDGFFTKNNYMNCDLHFKYQRYPNFIELSSAENVTQNELKIKVS